MGVISLLSLQIMTNNIYIKFFNSFKKINCRYVITCHQIPIAIGKKRGKVTGQQREKEKEECEYSQQHKRKKH